MTADTSEPATVVLHFPETTWTRRLAGYVEALGRPRSLLVLAGIGLGPSAAVWAATSGDERLLTLTLMLGVGTVALVVVLGALGAAVQRVPASTITFSEEGIRQEIGGVFRAHTWDWVVDFAELNGALEIGVRPPPMRTGQLARPEPQRLLVKGTDVDAETMAQLLALLETKAGATASRPTPRPPAARARRAPA